MDPREIIIFTSLDEFDNLLLKTGIKADQIEPLSMQDLVSETESVRVNTSLDYLLPRGCYFSRLPLPLRGGVIMKAPYIISVINNSFHWARFGWSFKRIILGSKTREQADFEIIKQGILVFDAEDEFNKILTQATEMINANLKLQKIIKNYFALLAWHFLSREDDVEDLLEVKEDEILHLIGQKDTLKPPSSRWGELCHLLRRQLESCVEFAPS